MKTLSREFDTTTTKRNYKQVAWFYDLWSLLTESKAARHVIKLADIHDKETILEVACGTGMVFKKIVQLNPNGINIGIDLSPDMLRRAQQRLGKLTAQNVVLKEGNVLQLDFSDERFDLVINNFMVDLMPVDTFPKIAKEFYRVLKPDGRLVISTFSFGKKRINKLWFWVAQNLPGLLTGCRPVSFQEYLIQAGFHIETSIEISQNTFPSEVIKARKKQRIEHGK